MKYIKLSLILLLLAVVTDVVVANAGVIYQRITVIEFLKKRDVTYTKYFEKKDEYYNPSYKNELTYTGLTDPCNNCEIEVRAYEENGDQSRSIIVKMGEQKNFTGTVQNAGNWRLSVKRYDFTLLDTNTKGYWYLNSSGIVN